jgi:hypothetical protein
MYRTLLVALLAAVVGGSASAAPAPPAGPDVPLLAILSDTGATRDKLPVFTTHSEAARYLDVLQRGYSGRLVRLYRAIQILRSRRDGTPIEPAYLVLTDHQGGFPREGFVLDDRPKSGVGYVDLHRNSRLTGHFAAIDQIFPHELLHHVLHQLVGETPEGGANQVHAIGVRTDPFTAFNEGFAEHAQVAAVDDPDAAPDTAALATDRDLVRRTDEDLAAYRRALAATWAPATRARLAFVLWFSQGEDVLRYHAVKANRFAFEPAVPSHLLRPRGLYHAYLLENILPGDVSGARKSQGRLLSSEGAVSALFARWMADRRLHARAAEAEVYAAFGVDPNTVSPIDHAYLKLFYAFDRHKPHEASAALRAYLETFPEDAPVVGALAAEIGFDTRFRPPPEIWLANDGFTTGTTVFDQSRALPRSHTFDLNAASVVDLLTVERMTREEADAILRAAPYSSLEDMKRVPEVSPAMRDRLAAMAARMTKLRAQAAEEAATLSLQSILMPYAYHAVLWLAVTALAAALLYLWARPVRWWRAALNGIGAAVLGLGIAWISDAWGGTMALILPVALFGAPAALWQLARHRSAALGVRALAAWTLAALAPFALTRPWG